MRSIASLWRAAISLLLCAAVAAPGPASAARRPRFGGTLRVELHAVQVRLDPRPWRAGSDEEAAGLKLAPLVFDRLVSLDNYGRFQPQLAVEWSHDAVFRRWQFNLRAGVKFSDGAVLSAADAVAALQTFLPPPRQASAAGSTVVIQSAVAMPELLEELASGRYFIFRVSSTGALVGTGPFVSAERPSAAASRGESADAPGPRLYFRANPDVWSGRPFLDAVDVTLGVAPLRQLYDLQLARADVVELTADLVKRAAQSGLRTWASSPAELYALCFDLSDPAAQDAVLREALSLSLDRNTMAGVLLQKQAEPAAALLPQWLSGYAFLFTVEINPTRAKELRASLPTSMASAVQPLRLRVEASGDVARLLGDRVVVNARQSQLILQALNRDAASPERDAPLREPVTLRLIAWRYASLSPAAELAALSAALKLAGSEQTSAAGPEELQQVERGILNDRRVLPLVLVPEFAGLGPNVRDWMPARSGFWDLADVWLDAGEPAPAAGPPGAQP